MIPSTRGKKRLMRIQTRVFRPGIETAVYRLNPQRQHIMNSGCQAIPIKGGEIEDTGLAMGISKQTSIHMFLITAGAIEIVREAMGPPTPTGVAHIIRTSLIIHEKIHQGGGVGALCIENEWTGAHIAGELIIWFRF